MMNYDKALGSIGEFGLYQKRLCLIVFVLAIQNGVHIPSVVFNNITPDYRCTVPGLSNDSYTIQDIHHKTLVQKYIPTGDDGEPYSQCYTYVLNDTQSGLDHNKTKECDQWVFDDSESTMSQSVQFKLVCGRVMYTAHNNLMALLGILVGSLIGGPLSDYFGRKRVTAVSLVLSCSLAGVMAVLQSFALVMACRFLVVVVCTTQFISTFVLLVETMGTSNRSIATIATMAGFTVGTLYMVLVQHLFRDWRTAQLVETLPMLSLLFFCWLMQESPRWLLTKNKQKEARETILYMARVNKVVLPQEMGFSDDVTMMAPDGENDNGKCVDEETTTSGSSDMKIWHICTSRRYVFYLVILSFSWVTINMVYYGLVLGVGDLIEGDIYVNFALQSSMEILSHGVCVCILERMSRKKIFCSSMIVTGLATLGIGVLVLTDRDIRWLSIAFYCLGKLFITIGFSLIYIITTELLPTKIRNSGLGFCSFVARFSGIVSPYIVSASLLIPGSFGKAFPVLIFGVLSLASGMSAILLPETCNAELPETLDDEEKDNLHDARDI